MAVHTAKSGPLLRISDDTFLPGLQDLASACHDAGLVPLRYALGPGVVATTYPANPNGSPLGIAAMTSR